MFVIKGELLKKKKKPKKQKQKHRRKNKVEVIVPGHEMNVWASYWKMGFRIVWEGLEPGVFQVSS